MQRWKTVDSIARGVKERDVRFRVRHGDAATAVPVTAFVVGGTPRIVWRAESSSAFEKLIDRLDGRLDGSEEAKDATPPRDRWS